jgi:hypothetical protein
VQPSISIHRKKITNYFFLINDELKTPSVEMACLLGIHNEIQAVQCEAFKQRLLSTQEILEQSLGKANVYMIDKIKT